MWAPRSGYRVFSWSARCTAAPFSTSHPSTLWQLWHSCPYRFWWGSLWQVVQAACTTGLKRENTSEIGAGKPPREK